MRTYIPARLRPLLDLAAVLDEVARALGREAMNRYDARRPRARRGGTLRPSAETPYWNALVACVKPRLRRRGDRANLARELGVHRARIGEYFDRPAAMPDAERALRSWSGSAVRPVMPAPDPAGREVRNTNKR